MALARRKVEVGEANRLRNGSSPSSTGSLLQAVAHRPLWGFHTLPSFCRNAVAMPDAAERLCENVNRHRPLAGFHFSCLATALLEVGKCEREAYGLWQNAADGLRGTRQTWPEVEQATAAR